MNTAADPWQYWRDALAGKKPEMHLDDPQTGYYEARIKNPSSGRVARSVVAYWFGKGGVLKCLQNNQPVDEARARKLWTWCGRAPMVEKAYRDIAEKGLP